MTTTTQEHNGVEITEKHMNYDEARSLYGSIDIQELNQRFEADALRATNGNCSQWAIYARGGITVVTEC